MVFSLGMEIAVSLLDECILDYFNGWLFKFCLSAWANFLRCDPVENRKFSF